MKFHPMHLVIALLLLVVIVDVCFIVTALRHADPVVPSYAEELR